MEQGIIILHTGKVSFKHSSHFLSDLMTSQGSGNMGHPQWAIWGKSHLK